MEVEGQTYYYDYPYYQDLDEIGKAAPTTTPPGDAEEAASEAAEVRSLREAGSMGGLAAGQQGLVLGLRAAARSLGLTRT